jgi:hypothetical protein
MQQLEDKAVINKFGKPDIKLFWALPVYNYDEKSVQVWVVTQKTIQLGMEEISSKADWGSIFDYDIIITRSGEGQTTEYKVTPCPKKPLEDDIKMLYQNMEINLQAIYATKEHQFGGDPFAKVAKIDNDAINNIL